MGNSQNCPAKSRTQTEEGVVAWTTFQARVLISRNSWQFLKKITAGSKYRVKKARILQIQKLNIGRSRPCFLRILAFRSSWNSDFVKMAFWSSLERRRSTRHLRGKLGNSKYRKQRRISSKLYRKKRLFSIYNSFRAFSLQVSILFLGRGF